MLNEIDYPMMSYSHNMWYRYVDCGPNHIRYSDYLSILKLQMGLNREESNCSPHCLLAILYIDGLLDRLKSSGIGCWT